MLFVGSRVRLPGSFTVLRCAECEALNDIHRDPNGGTQLHSPEIQSFEDGKLTWRKVTGAVGYALTVNGTAVSDGGDGLFRGTSYTFSGECAGARVDIAAVGDGVWFKDSPATPLRVGADGKTLFFRPIENYTVDGEALRWGKIGGASGYSVVDLDFNAVTVTDAYFDMAGKNLVYGVYPVGGGAVKSAAVEPVYIPYLRGRGSKSEPYSVRTPFDLRAIDYYEQRYAETGGERNFYKIERDLDFSTVNSLDTDSNIYTLRKPFFGCLDGNGKKLRNIRVVYDGGYWSLFELIAPGGEVADMVFRSPVIENRLQSADHPLNAAIAAVAYRNRGTVSRVTVDGAEFIASGGEIAGVVSRNFGTVEGCKVSGLFRHVDTGLLSQGCMAMAGVALDNRPSGKLIGNTVKRLRIEGSTSSSGEAAYNNIMNVGGIVAYNRGAVSGNNVTALAVSRASHVCAAVVACGTPGSPDNNAGAFTVDGKLVTSREGGEDDRFMGIDIGRSEVRDD